MQPTTKELNKNVKQYIIDCITDVDNPGLEAKTDKERLLHVYIPSSPW